MQFRCRPVIFLWYQREVIHLFSKAFSSSKSKSSAIENTFYDFYFINYCYQIHSSNLSKICRFFTVIALLVNYFNYFINNNRNRFVYKYASFLIVLVIQNLHQNIETIFPKYKSHVVGCSAATSRIFSGYFMPQILSFIILSFSFCLSFAVIAVINQWLLFHYLFS
jgi:hypothetical protein